MTKHGPTPVSIEAKIMMYDEPEAHQGSGMEVFSIEHREGSNGEVLAFATTEANAKLIVTGINCYQTMVDAINNIEKLAVGFNTDKLTVQQRNTIALIFQNTVNVKQVISKAESEG